MGDSLSHLNDLLFLLVYIGVNCSYRFWVFVNQSQYTAQYSTLFVGIDHTAKILLSLSKYLAHLRPLCDKSLIRTINLFFSSRSLNLY